jgi:hypothetical protein
MQVDQEFSVVRSPIHLQGWRVVGASARGAAHEKNMTPCQDANAHRHIDAEWVALAVADGLGSAAQSEVGARIAAECAVSELAKHVCAHLAKAKHVENEAEWREVMDEVVGAAREAVEKEAESLGIPVRELASTLLVLLLGPEMTVAVQIGDGAIVVSCADGKIEALTQPMPREYENETDFLTAAIAPEKRQFVYRTAPVEAAALLTDGLQMQALHFPGWKPSERFFQPVFKSFQAEADLSEAHMGLLRWLYSPELRQQSDDDLTLLVATRGVAASPELMDTIKLNDFAAAAPCDSSEGVHAEVRSP